MSRDSFGEGPDDGTQSSASHPDRNLSRPRGAQFALWRGGALIVLMFWAFYSAQIFLFGAELSKAIADERAPADRRVETNLTEHEV
ncbi:hypothetical protein [Bradyrhizobium sp. B120]|uniref:hypothetical protein n=1 Tax=Bradyrhizobium sp. B120 TaxID=3410088 RepID=UPI003B97E23C